MVTEYLHKLFGLDGQVIVVIGGTGVLGGALCDGLAQAGAHVVVAGRSQHRGVARAEAIEQLGGEGSFEQVDVTDRTSIEQLLSRVAERHTRVQGLINCAGVNSPTPFFEITDDEFERLVDSNVRAVMTACQVFGRHMVDLGGGSIVNIGSVTSFRPLSRVFTYSATKAAVLSLTQNLARELAPHQVRVNCLCPGFFPAEQNRKVLDQSRVDAILQHTPMQRMGEPQELVGATLLLMSSVAGSFLTGEAIYVDGGFTAMTI